MHLGPTCIRVNWVGVDGPLKVPPLFALIILYSQSRPAKSGAAAERDQRKRGEGDKERENKEDEGGEGAKAAAEGGEEGSPEEHRREERGHCVSDFLKQTGSLPALSFKLLFC